MHGIHSEIKSLGASLIAISPDQPDKSLSQVEKENLEFSVLSDVKGEVMKKYNIAWEIPEVLRKEYRKLNIDFSKRNTEAGWVVPIPATFIIDGNGVVQYCRTNEDYTKRMEPSEILEILHSL